MKSKLLLGTLLLALLCSTTSAQFVQPFRGVRICLDAGVGGDIYLGSDKEQTVTSGLAELESRTNMVIVLFLKEMLERGGAEVVLTRVRYSPPLPLASERVARANESGAVIMLSIQHNYSKNPRINFVNSYVESSINLNWVKGLVDELNTQLQLDKVASEAKTFPFLEGVTIPYVVVNCGFITDPDYRRQLGKLSFNRQQALAIFNGFRSLFEAFDAATGITARPTPQEPAITTPLMTAPPTEQPPTLLPLQPPAATPAAIPAPPPELAPLQPPEQAPAFPTFPPAPEATPTTPLFPPPPAETPAFPPPPAFPPAPVETAPVPAFPPPTEATPALPSLPPAQPETPSFPPAPEQQPSLPPLQPPAPPATPSEAKVHQPVEQFIPPFINPVNGQVDQTWIFGEKWGELPLKYGISFNVREDTPVKAIADGTIMTVAQAPDEENNIPYPNTVILQHTNSLHNDPVYSVYGNLKTMDVAQGQEVKTGDPIGTAAQPFAASGDRSTPFEFEIRVGSNRRSSVVNPELLIQHVNPDTGVIIGRLLTQQGSLLQSIQIRGAAKPAECLSYEFSMTYGSGITRTGLWAENFAIADVIPGEYILNCDYGQERVNVVPNQVTFVHWLVSE